MSGRRAFTFITNRPAAPTRAEPCRAQASQHAICDPADEFKGWQPLGLGARRRFDNGFCDLVSHAGKPRRGAVGDVQQGVGEFRFE